MSGTNRHLLPDQDLAVSILTNVADGFSGPCTDHVRIAVPGFLNPFTGIAKIDVTGRDQGIMRESSGFADAILDRLVHNAYRLELSGQSLRTKTRTLRRIGFVEVLIADRNEWYLDYSKRKVERMTGEDRHRFERVLGKDETDEWIRETTIKTLVVV